MVLAMAIEGISKSAFAEKVGVTPGRVSQWISAGKIQGEALVGSGRKARIRAYVAVEQLRTTLDVDHRVRASARAQLDGISAPTTAEQVITPARPAISDVEQQIQAERLEGFRRDNRRKAEEEAARRGRYTLTDDAAKSMGRLAAMLIGLFESWLGELASKLAAAFGLPQRDVLHVLRTEFRLFRAAASTGLRREAVELPALVEDDPNLERTTVASDQTQMPIPEPAGDLAADEGQGDDVDY
jgi:DNA-binding transcriptional regulator YdaS (Cro superfamily)